MNRLANSEPKVGANYGYEPGRQRELAHSKYK